MEGNKKESSCQFVGGTIKDSHGKGSRQRPGNRDSERNVYEKSGHRPGIKIRKRVRLSGGARKRVQAKKKKTKKKRMGGSLPAGGKQVDSKSWEKKEGKHVEGQYGENRRRGRERKGKNGGGKLEPTFTRRCDPYGNTERAGVEKLIRVLRHCLFKGSDNVQARRGRGRVKVEAGIKQYGGPHPRWEGKGSSTITGAPACRLGSKREIEILRS